MRVFLILAMLVLFPETRLEAAAERVDRNVVYGMYSGLALLMDVYRPAQPNGAALVAIQGSGWYAPLRYDAAQLNTRPEVVEQAQRFMRSGYTVFVINHRSAPRFHFPAQLEDAVRAVRYVRFHAPEYSVDPARVGAWGTSSGGHLALLLGLMDGGGDAGDADPVNRLDSKVRAVATMFAPSDMTAMSRSSERAGAVVALMGFEYLDPASRQPGSVRDDEFENAEYRRASPITYVTREDPPTLLFHGDEDRVVPLEQSEKLEHALRAAGVKVRFVKVSGGNHGRNFRLPEGDPRVPDYLGEAVQWFDKNLAAAR